MLVIRFRLSNSCIVVNRNLEHVSGFCPTKLNIKTIHNIYSHEKILHNGSIHCLNVKTKQISEKFITHKKLLFVLNYFKEYNERETGRDDENFDEIWFLFLNLKGFKRNENVFGCSKLIQRKQMFEKWLTNESQFKTKFISTCQVWWLIWKRYSVEGKLRPDINLP